MTPWATRSSTPPTSTGSRAERAIRASSPSLSDGMTKSRANLFRYPPGAIGRRHSDPIQEEVFVVLDGTLTIHMGEGDEPIEQHELAKGSVLIVQPGTALQLSNRHDDELRLFIVRRPAGARRVDVPRADRLSAFDDVRSIVPAEGLGRDHGPRRPRRAADPRTRRARAGRDRRDAQPRPRAARARPPRLDPLPRRRRGARARPGRDLGDPLEHATPRRSRPGRGQRARSLRTAPLRVGARRSGRGRTRPLALETSTRPALYSLSVSSPGSLFTIGGSM